MQIELYQMMRLPSTPLSGLPPTWLQANGPPEGVSSERRHGVLDPSELLGTPDYAFPAGDHFRR